MEINLVKMKRGDEGVVTQVGGLSHLVQRFHGLGIRKGASIRFMGRAPLLDPISIQVGSETTLVLRYEEAFLIHVELSGATKNSSKKAGI